MLIQQSQMSVGGSANTSLVLLKASSCYKAAFPCHCCLLRGLALGFCLLRGLLVLGQFPDSITSLS